MNYIGIDGNVHNDELKHWKYIKKIKSGSGWRYFYTPEEIRAFYNETRGKAESGLNSTKRILSIKAGEVKKTVRSEAAGVKRMREASKGRGDNVYSGDGKTYSKYDRKNKKLGEKNYKTGKVERGMLKAKRATSQENRDEVKDRIGKKINKGKEKVSKMLAPTEGGTITSQKTLVENVGRPGQFKRNNKATTVKTKNGTLTSKTLYESVDGKTTVNRPYVPTEKEKKYIKRYQKKAKKDEGGRIVTSKNLKTTYR